MAFRVLFTIAAYYDLNIDQINVKISFFYSLINQLFMWIQILKGFESITTKKMIYKLFKVQYGLKQASRF